MLIFKTSAAESEMCRPAKRGYGSRVGKELGGYEKRSEDFEEQLISSPW